MISIQFADPDGFLYFTYSSQESFGWRQQWANQSYVTIWMFVYFSKHGQIYVYNNLEGFACRPIYFRKQSFNKRKFPALEWEMQNHLANVNFHGYRVWSHDDHCVVHCCTLSLCHLGSEMIITDIQISIQRSSQVGRPRQAPHLGWETWLGWPD